MTVDTSLEAMLVAQCGAAGLTLGTAESCTGGLIAHCITNVPGASAIFRGAVVAYANDIKLSLLGVDEELLRVHGAVSEPVVLAMAEGGRRCLGADMVAAATGIAGPEGGTPDKPVGTVWLAVAGNRMALTRRFRFTGDRDAVKGQTADAALALLLELTELS